MKVAAYFPIKFNNQRVPGKNIKPLSDGTPLMHLIQRTLLKVSEIDEIYCYCSSEAVTDYLLDGVKWLKRDPKFDLDNADVNELHRSFCEQVKADIYIQTHSTAPFLSVSNISEGLAAVISGKYDSAFTAKRLQEFLWCDGKPVNYSPENIPRTQDLKPYFAESSGYFIYRRELMMEHRRKIGNTPYMVEVSEIESIDIDYPEDFEIANAIYTYRANNKEH